MAVPFAFTALYTVSLFGSGHGESVMAYGLLLSLCFACLSVLVFEFSKDSFDPFAPIIYLTAFYLVEFVIRNAFYLHDGVLPEFYGDAIDIGKQRFALGMGLLSYILLVTGYYFPRLPERVAGWLPSFLPGETRVSPKAFLPLMLITFGLGLLGWKFKFDYFGGITNYIIGFMQYKYVLITDAGESTSVALWNITRDVMNFVVPLGYIIIYRGSRSVLLKIIWILCYLSILFLSVLSGFRSAFLMTIMSLFLLHHYFIKRFSRQGIVIAFFCLIIAVGLLTYLQSILYVLTGNWEEQGVGYAFKGVLKTAVTFDALWGICSTFPDKQPYLAGATFYDMLLAFIPRLFWEAKKEIYGINEINMLIGMPTHFQLSASMPGELFANFGIPGMAGMFFYGILFRAVDLRKNQEAGWTMAYAVFFSARWLVIFWMGFTAIVTTVYSAIPFFIIMRIINLLPRKRCVPGTNLVAKEVV